MDPKYYSLASLGTYLMRTHSPYPQIDDPYIHCMRAAQIAVLNQLLLYKMPTYFVDSQFAAACTATNPPEDYSIGEIHLPMPAMVLVFHHDFVASHLKFQCPFIGIARLPSGTHEKHPLMAYFHDIGSENEMLSMVCPVITEEGDFVWYCGWIPTVYQVGKIETGFDEFCDDSSKIVEMLRARDPNDKLIARIENHKGIPNGEEEDKKFIRKVQMLAVKTLLCVSAAPGYLTTGSIERKARVRQGIVEREELWGASFIGRGYQIKRGTSDGEGTHASPRVHWRRGHWHHVVHGKGRQLRKLNWFEPVLVNIEQEEKVSV